MYLGEWHKNPEDHPATTSWMERDGMRNQQMGNKIMEVDFNSKDHRDG